MKRFVFVVLMVLFCSLASKGQDFSTGRDYMDFYWDPPAVRKDGAVVVKVDHYKIYRITDGQPSGGEFIGTFSNTAEEVDGGESVVYATVANPYRLNVKTGHTYSLLVSAVYTDGYAGAKSQASSIGTVSYTSIYRLYYGWNNFVGMIFNKYIYEGDSPPANVPEYLIRVHVSELGYNTLAEYIISCFPTYMSGQVELSALGAFAWFNPATQGWVYLGSGLTHIAGGEAYKIFVSDPAQNGIEWVLPGEHLPPGTIMTIINSGWQGIAYMRETGFYDAGIPAPSLAEEYMHFRALVPSGRVPLRYYMFQMSDGAYIAGFGSQRPGQPMVYLPTEVPAILAGDGLMVNVPYGVAPCAISWKDPDADGAQPAPRFFRGDGNVDPPPEPKAPMYLWHKPENGGDELVAVPRKSIAFGNYPNPVKDGTWVPYQLAEPAYLTVRIYAVSGMLIRTIQLPYREAGAYIVRQKAAYWDGRDQSGEAVGSGVYFFSISANGRSIAVVKMAVIR